VVKRWVSVVRPYRPLPGTRLTLDAEYARGDWDYLGDSSELPRFSVVVGYCHHFKPGGSILEIGCGEGLLADRLDRSKYSRYLGVDLSEEAIARTAGRQDRKTSFIAEDAVVMRPRARFDVIVFNECLEYFADPLALVRRYEEYLDADGVFIVSIFNGIDRATSRLIWRRLQSIYASVAETRVRNERRYEWTIKVLRPSVAGPAART
jgi:2-polyprenyl-3-methyl-5-hydroxy-6-metoxy-1,4-benzoquinol methylase